MTQRRGFRWVRLLLVPPYVAIVCVAFYDRATPTLWGFPFFYWYQLLWIPLGALLLYPIYCADVRDAAKE